MNLALALIGIAGIAYLVGAIPFGFLTARFAKGIDIRREGSGNIGATNVGRVLGPRWGTLVLIMDCLKGFLPVFFLPELMLTSDSPVFLHACVIAGLGAVVGHMFPCWLRFRGGKGVATALGAVLVLAPWATLVAFGMFVAVFGLFQIVSLSSILAAVAFAVFQMIWLQPAPFSEEKWSLTAFSLAVPILILIRHRTNIIRLLKGEEPHFRSGTQTTDDINSSSPAKSEAQQPSSPNSPPFPSSEATSKTDPEERGLR